MAHEQPPTVQPTPVQAIAIPAGHEGVGPARRARALVRMAGGAALAPVYRAYEARLRAEVLSHPVPQHVALIMDGNRRWARELGLSEVRAGHTHGADKAVELLDWCAALGIREVTLWALSLENLQRPPRRSRRSPRSPAGRSRRSRSGIGRGRWR